MDFNLICLMALSISALHTFSGPDHYLPFIVLSRSKKWSLKKTVFWTSLCGLAHVLSSVVLGVLGFFLGWTLSKTFDFESIRGGFASWMLFGFGCGYVLYAIYNLNKNKVHKHFDTSGDGEIFVFEHQHGQSVAPNQRYKITPWVMFFIFASGPSEPMIPLIIYPAIDYSLTEVGVLIIVYTLATVLTMVALVLVGFYGANSINYKGFEKYIEIISGSIILTCGVGMLWFGW
ncbi:hypothetical protein CXF59_13695 [Flavobacterium sp. ALD4]|uniref:hypothetical protein n=1 Tax=Flavobacterium sp. ALD4 TaxID=2058314 RepID=UPI000C31FFBE|nr:hypothetical protein [Flavobacterium sp. ALD4]PKH66958.1 hypothetical protein CXF59_13695 [Flavobacterium sp. ALD4]